MLRLPSTWVERHRVGRRVECALTDRGRGIVNCEFPARITGQGAYIGLRGRPNLAQAAIRWEHFGSDITPLRFPFHIQGLVDEVARGCSYWGHVDRHPAFDQLTSWLEIGDRAHATLLDTRTRRRATSPAQLGQVAAASCAIEHPTPGDQITQLRASLIKLLAGSIEVVDPREYAVFPVRAINGAHLVLGFLLPESPAASFTWAGMFHSSDRFRDWLRDERGLITSVSDFTSLAHVEKLAIWVDR
jgi:hypothetical protein